MNDGTEIIKMFERTDHAIRLNDICTRKGCNDTGCTKSHPHDHGLKVYHKATDRYCEQWYCHCGSIFLYKSSYVDHLKSFGVHEDVHFIGSVAFCSCGKSYEIGEEHPKKKKEVITVEWWEGVYYELREKFEKLKKDNASMEESIANTLSENKRLLAQQSHLEKNLKSSNNRNISYKQTIEEQKKKIAELEKHDHCYPYDVHMAEMRMRCRHVEQLKEKIAFHEEEITRLVKVAQGRKEENKKAITIIDNMNIKIHELMTEVVQNADVINYLENEILLLKKD